MNEVPDTELFSAYVDGELTADDQTRVEQILATSPEARQLVEELRALGSTLQGLPQEKLDEDLSTRVLELAERRMLLPDRPPDDAADKPSAGRAAETLKPAEADPIGWLGIPWREISWRGMLSKRALIWSGVIVATATAIYCTTPPASKLHHDIAKQDEVAKHEELARLERKPAALLPAAPAEERSKSSMSDDGSWRAPAGEARKREAVDGLVKAGVGRMKDTELMEKKAEGRKAVEEKLSVESIAENRPAPAAAPMPIALAPAAAGQPAPLMADTARPAAEPPLPAVAISKALGANGALNSRGANTYAGGTTMGKVAAETPVNPKRGSGEVDAKDAGRANDRAAKGGETTQIMNGNYAVPNGNLAGALQVPATNAKGGPTMQYGFAVEQAAPATYVLNVSKLAVQNKVFEKLLANQGLHSDQNSTNMAQDAAADKSSLRAGK